MQTVSEQKNSVLSCYDNIFNEVGIENWAHKTRIIIKLKTTIILVNEPFMKCKNLIIPYSVNFDTKSHWNFPLSASCFQL